MSAKWIRRALNNPPVEVPDAAILPVSFDTQAEAEGFVACALVLAAEAGVSLEEAFKSLLALEHQGLIERRVGPDGAVGWQLDPKGRRGRHRGRR